MVIVKVRKTKLKKCPKCELNYITDSEDLCSVCKDNLKVKQNYETIGHTSTRHHYDEEFTFKNETYRYGGKVGFKAFNSERKFIGICFMTDNKKLSSYGKCEIYVFSVFQEKYGMFHRFDFEFEMLKNILEKKGEYKLFID